MNTFLEYLQKQNGKYKNSLRRGRPTLLQVNMGNFCNQSCTHCHIEASPQGKNIMSKKIVDHILKFLSRYKIESLDITGGAAELNPHFDYFVTSIRGLVDELIVRSNLTVIFEPGKAHLPAFFKQNRVRLICSLPCYRKENVDEQRGKGVFEKSIKALQLLNNAGFAREEGLRLDLVYNPLNENLPPQAERLEHDYKQILKARYGIDFNHLLTITNVPIARFKNSLESQVKYGFYIGLLKENFNFTVVDNLMCRSFLSVGFDGKLYDCDFNLALGWALKDEFGNSLSLDTISPAELEGKEIALGEHCFACTAGYGSSCQGALAGAKAPGSLNGDSHKPEGNGGQPNSRSHKPEGNGAASDSRSHNLVKEYYGKILKTKNDLKTNACCLTDSLPGNLGKITAMIHPQIKDKFYGCGSPIPPLLEGCRGLDLGCGTGRDAYVASYLVGERGFVIGVDMTDEQLEIAQKHSQWQMEKFGFSKRNVEFKKGYIENLKKLGIEDNSIDLVISNCVINLSPDKESVFREILRVLKPGGELYFSDVFSGRRIPEHLKDEAVLYGECLAGALYIEDFRRLLRELGCLDYRVVSKKKISLDQPEMEKKAGMIDFYSMTVRAFKLDTLEDICEDYGQAAAYSGTIPGHSRQFILDDRHIFKTNKPMLVCGNTASMLLETRYGSHFKLTGDRSIHYGPFGCLSANPQAKENGLSKGACC